MNDSDDTRPFFPELWTRHHFQTDIVACEAGVPEDTVLTMLRYQSVRSQDATRVLAALSRLYHEDYSLSTVRVRLPSEETPPSALRENKSEVAHLMAEIDTEYDAARTGLLGLAQGTSQHAFITKRMEIIEKHLEGLTKVASPETMMEVMSQLGEKRTP